MTWEETEAWKGRAAGLLVSVSLFRDDRDRRRAMAWFENASKPVVAAVRECGGWDEGASLALSATFRPRIGRWGLGRPTLQDTHAFALKCLKAAHAIVMGGTLSAVDAEFIRSLGHDTGDARIEGAAVAAVPGPVGFAYIHEQSGHHGRRSHCLGRGTAMIDEVHAADAPVACRLMGHEGSWVDVRRAAEGFLRPVLAPGTWRPVTLPEFSRAANDGRGWVDNPFLERSRGEDALLDLADLATSPDPTSRRFDDRSETERALCLSRSGRLCVIDGIVHRHTPAPTLHLVREWPWQRIDNSTQSHDCVHAGFYRREAGEATHPFGWLRFGWRLGDLHAFARQETWRAWGHIVDWSLGSHGEGPDPIAIPIGDHAQADLLAEVVEGLGQEYGGDRVRNARRVVPWEIVDATAFPRSGRTLRGLLAEAVADGILPSDTSQERGFALLDGRGWEVVGEACAEYVGDRDMDRQRDRLVALAAFSEASRLEAQDVLDEDLSSFSPH